MRGLFVVHLYLFFFVYGLVVPLDLFFFVCGLVVLLDLTFAVFFLVFFILPEPYCLMPESCIIILD